MLKLMKLVSTKTLYGGPSAELCLKKSEEDVASLRTGGTRENARVDEKKEGGGGQESIFSVATGRMVVSRRRSRRSGAKAGERGFRRCRSDCPRTRTHTCFTSGASSRFFFFCLPLSTRASLGFKMRLTSANFFVLVLFLPMPADPGA